MRSNTSKDVSTAKVLVSYKVFVTDEDLRGRNVLVFGSIAMHKLNISLVLQYKSCICRGPSGKWCMHHAIMHTHSLYELASTDKTKACFTIQRHTALDCNCCPLPLITLSKHRPSASVFVPLNMYVSLRYTNISVI